MGYTDDDVMEDVVELNDAIDNSRFEKYGDIMIDIETLSTYKNAVVLEISAVEFNRKTGEIGEVFDKKLYVDEQLAAGRRIDEKTLYWWFKQSDDAKDKVINNAVKTDIFDSLLEFSRFVSRCDNLLYDDDNDRRTVKVWGNGSIFDIAIVESLYEQYYDRERIPWKYWAVNDVRTIVDLNPEVKKNCNFEGTPHCAVDDCKHEIKYLVGTLNTIRVVKDAKEGDMPHYLDILLPKTLYEYDAEDFPYDDFLLKDDNETVKLTVDLKEGKLLDWKESYGTLSLFMKVVDSGTYIVRNSEGKTLYRLEGYVPNKAIPPTHGYGDYIELTIDKDGLISNWYDYNLLDFSEFDNE